MLIILLIFWLIIDLVWMTGELGWVFPAVGIGIIMLLWLIEEMQIKIMLWKDRKQSEREKTGLRNKEEIEAWERKWGRKHPTGK